MPTRLSLLFLLALCLVVAAQGPFTSSLVFDPNNPNPVVTVTVLDTVTITGPATTITLPSSISTTTTTTTTTLTSSLFGTVTTTIHSNPDTPSSSVTLVPAPGPNSNPLTRNPGALAGLIVGICVVVAGLIALAWFTAKRHRSRELKDQTVDQTVVGAVRRSASAGNVPPVRGRSGIVDDDPDIENQSSVGHGMRSSSTGHGALVSAVSRVVGPGESPEQQVDYESGYLAIYTTAASSAGGHSSHGHGTTNTRDSSLTQVNTTVRNTSPTLSRQGPNRTRFSLSPDRVPQPVAWHASRSEAPTRRGSVDDASTLSYHRASSEPFILHDASKQTPIYPRRQSSEVSRTDAFPRPGPVHTPPPNPPSSLLRPPSATQVPTLQTLQRSHPVGVYLGLPFVNEPDPSPAASSISVLSGREGLLNPNHPESLSDDRDHSRRIGLGVVSGLRDSTSMVDADTESEVHPN